MPQTGWTRRSIVCARAESDLESGRNRRSGPGDRCWFVTPTRKGYRKFIAVGGDGTSYEVVNGLFPSETEASRATSGFSSPGNGQFVSDATSAIVVWSLRSRLCWPGAHRPCDVLRLTHEAGVLHYINLLSMGFSADVATLRARRFSGWGEIGYQSSIFISLARFRRRPFPSASGWRCEIDRRPCLFLTFSNSKFTGGTMMIAPKAEVNDGLIEFVRWGPIGRLGLIRNLPTLYDGTHINHPLAERRQAKRIDFELDAPVDVMVDGEVLTLHCRSLDVLPSASERRGIKRLHVEGQQKKTYD